MGSSQFDRRSLLTLLGGIAAYGTARASAPSKAAKPAYDRAIVIDAQGSIYDPIPATWLSALVMDDKARERQREFFEYRKAQGIAAPGEAADVFNIEKILGGNFARLFTEVWG